MAEETGISPGGPISENDLSAMRAMVWQAVGRHADQLGIAGVPAADMARMVDHAMGMLSAVPPDQMKTISLTSPTMMAAVVAGYGSVYGPLSEQKMNELRAAADTRSPLGQGETAASGGSLWGQPGFPGGGWMSAGRGGMTSSARFEGMPGTAGAPGSYAAYASQYSGMGFDAGTIAVFAAVKLDREAYNDLAKDFDRGRIVEGARASKSLGFSGADEVRDVVETDQRFIQAMVAWHTAKPADKGAAADEVRNIYKGLTPDEQKEADDVIRTYNQKNKDAFPAMAPDETITDDRVEAIRTATGDLAKASDERRAMVTAASAAVTSEEQLEVVLDAFGVEAPTSEPAPDKAADAGAKKDETAAEKPVDTAALVSRPKPMTLGNG